MKTTFRPLTDRETEMLTAFAREHGPGWKHALSTLWMRAAAQPTLHCLRNSHGPSWLAEFHMAQPARIVSGGRVVVDRGSAALGLRKGDRLTVVEALDDLVVIVDDAGRVLGFNDVGDRGARVTTLRRYGGDVEVRALNCDAPRE